MSITFRGKPRKMFFKSDDFRMYSFAIDKDKYPDVHLTKYGDATIQGEMHELSIGLEYEVTATEKYSDKYGYSYKVANIRTTKRPNNMGDMYDFLKVILTANQAETLYRVYPDVVDRIMKNKEVDLEKLPGIGEITWNKIKTKIEENYIFADLVSYFDGIFSFKKIKELYEKYSSAELVMDKLKRSPYNFLTDNISNVGFKTADSILLRLEKKGKLSPEQPLKSSPQRCRAYMIHVLKENENEGNTKMRLEELRKSCKSMVPECAIHFKDCIQDEAFYYDDDENIAALRWTYNIEAYIADRLKKGLTINNCYNVDVEKFRIVKDGDKKIVLSDEQVQGIKQFCENNISIIDGPAGSGKSSSMNAIVELLDQTKKSYVLLAPTGRASKVLSEYTKKNAATIHRGLAYSPMIGWVHCKENPLSEDVVIVDEFSMVDIYLFKHLLDAIDFERTKLLIVGDSAQLNSVQCGNCLHNMIDSKRIPLTTLTKIFRYDEGGLMKVATDVRMCKPYLLNIKKKVTKFGVDKDYVFIAENQQNIVNSTVRLYQKLLKDGKKVEDIVVLSAYNKGEYGTIVLNKKLQAVANQNIYTSKGYKFGDNVYYVDDIVMQNVNNYRATKYDMEFDAISFPVQETAVYNGEVGKIIKIVNGGIVIDFDGNYVFYKGDDLKSIQLGYAISIHKVQGSSQDTIIMITPKAHTYMLNSNLLYVGLTRMKKQFYHLGDPKVVNRAIRRKENLQRKTFLLDLIRT